MSSWCKCSGSSARRTRSSSAGSWRRRRTRGLGFRAELLLLLLVVVVVVVRLHEQVLHAAGARDRLLFLAADDSVDSEQHQQQEVASAGDRDNSLHSFFDAADDSVHSERHQQQQQVLLELEEKSTCGDGCRRTGAFHLQEQQEQPPAQAACPLKMSLLDRYPGDVAACAPGMPEDKCCQALLSRLGVLTSQYLRDTGNFEVPGRASAEACLALFDGKMQRQGVGAGTVPRCFPDAGAFTQGPDLCQGIQTRAELARLLGPAPPAMARSCAGPLREDIVCNTCNADMAAAVAQLAHLGGSTSRCLAFVVIYAAGVVNRAGPADYDTADCVLGVHGYADRAAAAAGRAARRRRTVTAVGTGAAAVVGGGVAVAVAACYCARKRRARVHRAFVDRNDRMLRGIIKPYTGLVWFRYEVVKAATRNFASANLVGEGGFAKVYRARLPDPDGPGGGGGGGGHHLMVAVKRFTKCSPDTDADFRSEVEVIARARHRNLLPLRGCCIASTRADGHQRLLISDLMRHGSLHDYLFGAGAGAAGAPRPVLPWPDRARIALGTAKGIAYLHDDMQPAIIHCDIKSSNILLDDALHPHVADFGLARTIALDAAANAGAADRCHYGGTFGFCAPEYALYGRVSDKCDVYSFGVVLLELVSGRRALEPHAHPTEHTLIADWAWAMLKAGRLPDIVDKRLRRPNDDGVDDNGAAHDAHAAEMERFVRVAVLCAHPLVAFRPRMADALKMLQGDVPVPDMPDRPLPLLSPRSNVDSPRSYVVASGGTLLVPELQPPVPLLRAVVPPPSSSAASVSVSDDLEEESSSRREELLLDHSVDHVLQGR